MRRGRAESEECRPTLADHLVSDIQGVPEIPFISCQGVFWKGLSAVLVFHDAMHWI